MASEHHLREMQSPASDVLSLSILVTREENDLRGSSILLRDEDGLPLRDSTGKHVRNPSIEKHMLVLSHVMLRRSIFFRSPS